MVLCLAAYDRIEPTARNLAPRFAVLGLVLGFALSTRFVNGLLAPLIGALLLVNAPREARRRVVGLGLLAISLFFYYLVGIAGNSANAPVVVEARAAVASSGGRRG